MNRPYATAGAPPLAPTRPRQAPVREIETEGGATPKVESTWQVVLHNDDHNEAGYVVRCLMKVFRHGPELAAKIMMEAHTKGRAIAEVESEESAVLHRDQLRSMGLSATVEKVA